MKNPVPYILRDQTLWLSPERCILWEEENTLIVADLHLGKSGHFRKEGIGIPQRIYKADLQRLMAQLYLIILRKMLRYCRHSAALPGDLKSNQRKEIRFSPWWMTALCSCLNVSGEAGYNRGNK